MGDLTCPILAFYLNVPANAEPSQASVRGAPTLQSSDPNHDDTSLVTFFRARDENGAAKEKKKKPKGEEGGEKNKKMEKAQTVRMS